MLTNKYTKHMDTTDISEHISSAYKILYDKYHHDVIIVCNKVSISGIKNKKKIIFDIEKDTDFITKLITDKKKYFQSRFAEHNLCIINCLNKNKLTLKYENKFNINNIIIDNTKINIYDLIKLSNSKQLKLKIKLSFYSVLKSDKLFINAKVSNIQIISDIKIKYLNEQPTYKSAYSSKSKSIVENILKVLGK